MLPTELQQPVRHMQWADSLIWNAVLTHPPAASDPRVRDLLHHAHGVHWAYLQVWRNEPLDLPEVESFSDIVAIRAWALEYYERVGPFLEALEPEELSGEVRFPWADRLVERWGVARPANLAESILQITSHTTYHRGQINARLRELQGEPPLTDFIVWIWQGRPDPEWTRPIGA